YTYPSGLGWATPNMLTTIGAFILATGLLIYFINVLRRGISERPMTDAEPPISAAEPGAGATPSATCSRCRPSIRRGSTPCPTTSRKAPPPRPFRQSASSISASSRRSSRPAASAAIEPPADTAIPDHPHPPDPHRTPTPGLTRVGAQAPPTPFAPRNAEGAALRARVPPMHYPDKPNPALTEGSRLDAKRGSRLDAN